MVAEVKTSCLVLLVIVMLVKQNLTSSQTMCTSNCHCQEKSTNHNECNLSMTGLMLSVLKTITSALIIPSVSE